MFRIRDIHAFVAEDEEGEEGLCAFFTGGQWMPLVAADPARLVSIRPVAQAIAKQTGRPIKLIRFTQREEVETIKP